MGGGWVGPKDDCLVASLRLDPFCDTTSTPTLLLLQSSWPAIKNTIVQACELDHCRAVNHLNTKLIVESC